MNQKKVIIIADAVIVLLVLFIAVDYVRKGGLVNRSVSPNILYLTQPVNTFSGTVEKIEGNKITVSKKQTFPLPTPKTTTVTYYVTVTDKTQMYRFQSPSPIITATAPKLMAKDIKVGQIITVRTINDLRTMTGNTFEATVVNLPPIANALNGKIVSLNGNILTIKGLAFAPGAPPLINLGVAAPTAPQEKEYRIIVTPATEISQTSFVPPKPGEMPQPPKNEKLAPSDLKKDLRVTVYTDKDVNENSQPTALKIITVGKITLPTP